MTVEDAVKAAEIQANANKNEFDAGVKLYEQRERERVARQQEEDRVDQAVEAKIQRDFPSSESGPGIDPFYETMLKQLTRYYPGTSTDARYNKAKKVVSDQLAREQKLLDYQGRPLFGAWRPEAIKDHLNGHAVFPRVRSDGRLRANHPDHPRENHCGNRHLVEPHEQRPGESQRGT